MTRRTAGDGPGTIDDHMLRSMGMDPSGMPLGGGGGGGYYDEDMADTHSECRHCGGEIVNGEWTDGWQHTSGDYSYDGSPKTVDLDHPAAPDDEDYDDEGQYINASLRHLRIAAAAFVDAQNTTDRGELMYRAHRHASDLTGQLTREQSREVVKAFVAAVRREAGSQPEAGAGRGMGQRTAGVLPDFPDELMF